MKNEGQARARVAVHAELNKRGWSKADLARAADIDTGTAGDFLNGSRWPKPKTQGRIEQALGWEHGRIAAIVDGLAESADDVSAGRQDAADEGGVMFSLPTAATRGMTSDQVEELLAALTELTYRKSREIRGG